MQMLEKLNRNHDQALERKGAAGPAFLVWLFGGGLGLAVIVFVVLKVMGH